MKLSQCLSKLALSSGHCPVASQQLIEERRPFYQHRPGTTSFCTRDWRVWKCQNHNSWCWTGIEFPQETRRAKVCHNLKALGWVTGCKRTETTEIGNIVCCNHCSNNSESWKFPLCCVIRWGLQCSRVFTGKGPTTQTQGRINEPTSAVTTHTHAHIGLYGTRCVRVHLCPHTNWKKTQGHSLQTFTWENNTLVHSILPAWLVNAQCVLLNCVHFEKPAPWSPETPTLPVCSYWTEGGAKSAEEKIGVARLEVRR